MYRGDRRQGSGLGLLLLAAQVMRFGIDRIPPITLSCIAANVLIYLGLIDLPLIRQPLSNVCISALHVWHGQDFSRVLLSSFFHSNDWHLYYNMASFIWKGSSLENRIGSVPFAYMIMVFSVLTNAVYVGLGLLGQELFGVATYLTECAVGFSGVIFALKVVTTHYMSGNSYVLGLIPVPVKYAVWAELLMIHILVPNSSFMGHLAGIIVGSLYVYGPLHSLMDIFIATSPRGYRRQIWNSGYTYGSGFSGYAPAAANDREGPPHQHQAHYPSSNNNQRDNYRGNYESAEPQRDYNQYTGGMSEEEQVQEAIRQSQDRYVGSSSRRVEPSAPPLTPDVGGPSSGRLYPDLPGTGSGTGGHGEVEEMRRRRLRRFDAS